MDSIAYQAEIEAYQHNLAQARKDLSEAMTQTRDAVAENGELTQALAAKEKEIAELKESLGTHLRYGDRMNPVMGDLAAMFPGDEQVSDDNLICEAMGEIERLRHQGEQR